MDILVLEDNKAVEETTLLVKSVLYYEYDEEYNVVDSELRIFN